MTGLIDVLVDAHQADSGRIVLKVSDAGLERCCLSSPQHLMICAASPHRQVRSGHKRLVNSDARGEFLKIAVAHGGMRLHLEAWLRTVDAGSPGAFVTDAIEGAGIIEFVGVGDL